jgi:predicted Fe-Mo cluster-binding NifX family protein
MKSKKIRKTRGENVMRIAIPVVNDMLAAHFGHCQEFALFDAEWGKITGEQKLPAPPHSPGLLPRWLAEQGATHIVAGGMGQRAQQLFAAQGIEVVVGAPQDQPAKIAQQFLAGTLATAENLCDH